MWGTHVRWPSAGIIVKMNNIRMTKDHSKIIDKEKGKIIF